MLHIPPTEFWNMSLIELTEAINGFQEFNGGKEAPMQQDDLKEMMEVYPD
tara:strand:+ start:349 stop:498 length:150 start_codon:yes stop_codon:yes gene_type:complete